jgi:hypothetical protein
VSGSRGPITTATSPLSSRFGSIGSAEAPGLALEERVVSLVGLRGTGSWLSLPGEIPGTGTGISFSSQMEGLNKSCVNTPKGDGSWLNLRWVRVSAASLSHRRIWWSLKPSNSSSNLLTSYGMQPCGSCDSSCHTPKF